MRAAILAGGKSKRFGFGLNKLFYMIDGKPLIMHTIERLLQAKRIDKIFIVASEKNAGRLRDFGFTVLVDEFPAGPIGGVYTALSRGDVFIAGGDMPNIKPEFVDYLIEMFKVYRPIACVPRWSNGYIEPLHAVYSKAFRAVLREKISSGENMLNKAVREANPCYIQIETLPEAWKESFFNVNKKEDLRAFSRV